MNRTLHFIWIGPQAAPGWFLRHLLRAQALHPQWTLRLHGNDRLAAVAPPWRTYLGRIRDPHYWAKVKDIVAFDILEREGGVCIDGDFYLFRSLDRLPFARETLCGIAPLGLLGCGPGFAGWPAVRAWLDASLTPDEYMLCGPRGLNALAGLDGLHLLDVNRLFPSPGCRLPEVRALYYALCRGTAAVPDHVIGVTGHQTDEPPASG